MSFDSGDRIEVSMKGRRRSGWCVRAPHWVLLDGCRRPYRAPDAVLAYRAGDRPGADADFTHALRSMEPPRRKEWNE